MRSEEQDGVNPPEDVEAKGTGGEGGASSDSKGKGSPGSGDATDPKDPAGKPGIQVEGADGGKVLVQRTLPETMFVFPLRRAVPFPNLMMPLLLDTAESRDIIQKAEAHNGYVFLVLQKNGDQEPAVEPELHEVGVVARILKTLKLPDGSMSAMTQGLARGSVVKIVRKKPYLVARVKELVEIPAQGPRADSLFRLLQQNLQKLGELHDQLDPGFTTTVLNVDRPGALADFTGSVLRNLQDRQSILQAADVEKRLELAVQLVLGELELAQLDKNIQEEIRSKAEKAQKDYFLREQLKLIRRELGEEKDPRLLEVQRLETAIAKAGMAEVPRQRAQEELTRLKTTPVESAEYGVIRNYLDWLVSLPWSTSTEDSADLKQAGKVLDEDHYGLEEVKERILEFLAVRKLKPEHRGSILCFSGPPGVGKTSLGRSIARAMGRKFWRFSLGGMRDEAEIKGHRRTYVGAMPGRILQGLKACGSNNPILMLDEVDKLGSDFRGDPSSALLEVLDPEQNHAFLDYYLDVPFDLSKVMFLATANVLPQIPEPLRDRMEIIELPGYLLAEKAEIARRHLMPKQLERHGLTPSQLSLSPPMWQKLVPLYTREAGVRGLDKVIQRLCRKTALAVARGKPGPGHLSFEKMTQLLGRARFMPDERRTGRVPGVVQGLAWTPFGGDVLYLEVVGSKGKGHLQLTGSLGEVMTESARLALSYLKSKATLFGIDLQKFTTQDMHLHFPAGAIPKDGPSAGIAIACAFLSYLIDRPAPMDLAMTGELTLVGKVLPIGGVREKVLAARNFKLKRVILPAENRAEIEELKPELLEGLQVLYVENFEEVFEIVFAAEKAAQKKRKAKRPRGQR